MQFMHSRLSYLGQRKRWLIGAAFAVLGLLATCTFLRIRSTRDIEAYLGMASECHPAWRQLAFRQFGAGDSASDLLRRYPPSRREEFGPYGVYRYYQGDSHEIPFTELSIVTRNGKLLSAAAESCTWQFSFFQTADSELDKEYQAFLKERHLTAERRRLEQLEAKLRVFYSVNNRWPTNQGEFYFFVTGGAIERLESQRRALRKHDTGPTNLLIGNLGIQLNLRADGIADIALLEFPNEKRSVTKPDAEGPEKP